MEASKFSNTSDFDVVIIGAGISGINAGYKLQTELPNYTYTILEARGAIGGTWDLFRYPGIRSDSDLHTFGFSWCAWKNSKAIAEGSLIQEYIQDAAEEYGIDKHIKFHHKVVAADWSTECQDWSFAVDVKGETKQIRGRFVIFASGYYDYNEPLSAHIPGLENFKGTTVHPQFWPEDLDYAGKKVVIIGSGATAITLLPNMTDKAEKVTMLQRSPSYVVARPSVDPSGQWLKKYLPQSWASKLIRLKFLVLTIVIVNFCRAYPKVAIKSIKKRTEEMLPASIAQDPNFKPSYNPWEQRLCLCPDGDFYAALRGGKGDVVTDTIKTVTETGIVTDGGKVLDADVIVTATGLKMQVAGGSRVSVDGAPISFSDKYMWKSTLVQDIPNAAVVIGYTNASWTPGAEATAVMICRIMKYMEKKKLGTVVPRVEDESRVHATNLLNLKSTYIMAAKGTLPKAGDVAPWKPRDNYFSDLWSAKFGMFSGLAFEGSAKKKN
ncbi:hypothetical protein BP6252_08108 [Coleophoma cylindrospora]|uniref:Uncharacterized protein n=1 Tax=Coleophoma cylindrospora TaxID=1849047 RepID=A0A3D8RBZ8_9HELO|nr:hypothetical protein BP6252_08108 [Coleophoma cylindrospora]